MLKPLILALSLAVLVPAAHASIPGIQDDGMRLKEIQAMHYIKGMNLAGDDDVANKRYAAMRDAAMTVGAQHGYIEEMNRIRRQLVVEEKVWDDLFAFKDLMRIASAGENSLYFLPAVIHESEQVTSRSDDHNRILVSGQYYEIIKRERLVTNPPDWREYLLIDIPVDASKPVGALLPKTPTEQAYWANHVEDGWKAGVLQANSEMLARIRHMGSDYIGMIKYVRLVAEGKIEPSFVASATQNLVNQGSSMHLNQKTFAITSPAVFNGNVRDWKPLDLDPRGGYRTPDEKRQVNKEPR